MIKPIMLLLLYLHVSLPSLSLPFHGHPTPCIFIDLKMGLAVNACMVYYLRWFIPSQWGKKDISSYLFQSWSWILEVIIISSSTIKNHIYFSSVIFHHSQLSTEIVILSIHSAVSIILLMGENVWLTFVRLLFQCCMIFEAILTILSCSLSSHWVPLESKERSMEKLTIAEILALYSQIAKIQLVWEFFKDGREIPYHLITKASYLW